MRFYLIFLMICLLFSHAFAASFIQVGDYNKIPHYDVFQKTDNQHLDSLIQNTVMIITTTSKGPSRGTGFYIGKHADNHIFVTNAHVMNAFECKKSKITILTHNMTKKSVDCYKVLFSKFTNDNLDITVFTVKESSLQNFAGKGLTVNWNYSPRATDKLAQAGFGIKHLRRTRSSRNQLTDYKMNLNFDNDCVVASENDKLYFISNMKTSFTFFMGCDAAGGDSGSAIIDRVSGHVVGLLWGTGNSNKVLSSDELWNELIGTSNQRLYQHSSFAILMKSVSKYFKEIGVLVD